MSAPTDQAAPPPDRGSRPYYGSGYAGVGFRGIGGDLLRSFPRIAPPPIDPTSPGFASHLLARILTGPGGFRIVGCPVCRTYATVPGDGGWVPSLCGSCGTEFVATDGHTPPPPPPPPPVTPAPPAPRSPLAPPPEPVAPVPIPERERKLRLRHPERLAKATPPPVPPRTPEAGLIETGLRCCVAFVGILVSLGALVFLIAVVFSRVLG